MLASVDEPSGTTVRELPPRPRRVLDPVLGPIGRLLRRIGAAPLLYAIVAAVTVGYFIAAVPAGWGLDEQSHVNRAYQVQQGQLLPQLRDDGRTFGGEIPTDLQRFDMLGWDWANHVDYRAPYFQRHDFRDRAQYDTLGSVVLGPDSPTESVDFTNAGASSFVPYLPSAVGMRIGLALHQDVATVMVLGRVVNALVAIGLTTLAIGLLRRSRSRWLFMAVGLLPSVLFLDSYTTADSFTTAICMLFVAGIVRLCTDRHPRLGIVIGTAAAGLGVVAAKPTYVLLLALALLVPLARWTTARRSDAAGRPRTLREFGAAAAFLVVAAVPTLVLLSVTSPIAKAIRLQRVGVWQSVDSGRQVHFLLEHPTALAGILGRSLASFGEWWVHGLVGAFGYNAVDLMQPFSTIAIVGVVLAAVVADRLPRLVALGMTVVGAVTALAVVVALYLTFNVVGSPDVVGVQGRYFAPLVALLGVGIAGLVPIRARVSDRGGAALFTTLAVVPLVASVVQWHVTLY